jgi:GTPase SAR1 family protein
MTIMDNRYNSRQQPQPQAFMNGQQTYGQFGGKPEPSTAQPAMSATLDRVPLGTDEENSKLLDLIDRLRECRVDQFIDLPQVVAVGDQSSGKSSVLEAITSIPFPRASIACTRFATQIRLRRDTSLSQTVTKVSIIPHKSKDRGKYDSFSHTVDSGSDFGDIFQRATDLIFSGNTGNFLSRDILSIERAGPNLPHLTIVDLPGIIHNPTRTQTVADVEAISDLSKFYMHKERTIILGVVGCDSEYARQVIVRRCKEADPQGIRTLGVLTKPDMTLTAERENEFIDLACNRDERNRLQLGWHVLKNRAHNEMDYSANKRDEEEKRFFASTRWGQELEQSQLGVEELRKKLSTQLIRHIANEVFKVQGDIDKQLSQVQGKLKELGPGFTTIAEMRAELQQLCKRSGSLTREAVQGHGINPLGEDFFPKYNDKSRKFARNLRSRVVIMNEAFNDNMEKFGAAYIIRENAQPNQLSPPSKTPGQVPPTISRKEFIEREVQPLIRDNPGQELSVDINPRLVYRLFQSYSVKWPEQADKHVHIVQSLCEEFLTEVMAYGWPSRLRSRAWRGFVQQSLEARAKEATKELNELKKDRFRNVRTYHSSFEKKYYAQRSDTKKDSEPSSPLNKYEDTLNKMLLHYEHQLPSFISNVITQVIERHLIDGMEEIFEGERVHRLSDIEVKRLMEEDSVTAAKRRELKDQEYVLESGLEICRDIARRPDLGPYEAQEPALTTGYDSLTPTRNRPDSYSSYRSGTPPPSLPVRNPFSSEGYSSSTRKPVPAWDDIGDTYEDAAESSNQRPHSGGISSAVDTPTSMEDEDAQLKRAIEESKREAASQSRYSVAPPMPQRPPPSQDDADSINQGRNRRQGIGGFLRRT